ncbi:MAG: hypothetical protein ACUVTH_07045 [Thermogutta sp.]
MKLMCLIALIVTVLADWSSAQQIYYSRQREDQLFLEGLRQRHLFALARRYCGDKLAEDNLPLAERAILTSELIVLLNELSIEADDPLERESHRREAISVSEEFCQRFPDTDWRLFVSFTDLKHRVIVARVLRQESELTLNGTSILPGQPTLDQIRLILRETLTAMKQLNADLQEVLRRPRNRLAREDFGFSEQQWLSLEKHFQYEHAQAFVELARTYPLQSEDHTAGMVEAQKRLEVLSQLPIDHPLGVPARLSLAEVHRELGDFAGALRILQELPENKLTIRDRFAVRAELIRLALANQQVEALDRLLNLGRSIEGQTAPELDYTLLEAYLAKWKIARSDQPENARLWETKIREIVNDLRQKGPVAWARRAELLVTRQLAANEVPEDIDMNVYAAENAYRSKQWNEAIAAFDRAQKIAEKEGDVERSLQLGLAAAAIEHERGRHQQAWQRYHELCERFSKQDGIVEAAQLAVFHAGQLAKENPSEFLAVYRQELENYLRRWPHSQFACEVALFLGRLHAKSGDWLEATDYLLQSLELWLSPGTKSELKQATRDAAAATQEDSSQYSAKSTLEELKQCLDQTLEAMSEDPQGARKLGELSHRLANWAEKVGITFPDRDWHLRAAAMAVRILLWRGSNPTEAESLLNRFLPDSPESLQAMAFDLRMDLLSLQLESLAWLDQTAGADQITRSLREIPLTHRLRLLSDLGASLRERPPHVRKQSASLFAVAFEDLPEKWSTVDTPRRPKLGLAYAHLLILAEKNTAALHWLRQLAEEFPETGDIQEEYAMLLSQQREIHLLREALERFRTIAQRSPEASPRWFRAKYMTAWLQAQLGNPAHALDVIRVLETIHPDLGGDELRNRFLRLKELCQRQIVNAHPSQEGGKH